jgi:hypothetical protein
VAGLSFISYIYFSKMNLIKRQIYFLCFVGFEA